MWFPSNEHQNNDINNGKHHGVSNNTIKLRAHYGIAVATLSEMRDHWSMKAGRLLGKIFHSFDARKCPLVSPGCPENQGQRLGKQSEVAQIAQGVGGTALKVERRYSIWRPKWSDNGAASEIHHDEVASHLMS